MKPIRIIFFSFILFLSSFQNNINAEEKIFFVDLSYLVTNSIAGKTIFKQLDTLNKKYIAEFTKIENDINLKKEKAEKQKNIISENEYKIIIEKIKNEIIDYKKLRNNTNIKISNRNNKANIKLIDEINKILIVYSDEKKISMIVKKKYIIIGKSELDITSEILIILDKKIKKIEL